MTEPMNSSPENDAHGDMPDPSTAAPGATVLSPVAARSGARRGIYRILAISLVLVIIGFIIAWLVIGSGKPTTRPQADPVHPPASSSSS